MAEVTYAIVFAGGVLDGFQTFAVKAHLAKMLKVDADKMATLFSGKPVVLKRTADKQEAAKYGMALKKVGANIKVKVLKGDAAATPPAKPAAPAAAPATPAPGVPDTSALEVVPNEGNIFDAVPTEAAPAIDVSGIALAANDDAPLAEPVEVATPDIDLSALSVADNDGSPLVATTPDVAPTVDVPDFGLDEPGAVLETLREDVEAVSPDTSHLSLAFPGSDILDADDQPLVPPPVAPDTSKIHLVPNFDT